MPEGETERVLRELQQIYRTSKEPYKRLMAAATILVLTNQMEMRKGIQDALDAIEWRNNRVRKQ